MESALPRDPRRIHTAAAHPATTSPLAITPLPTFGEALAILIQERGLSQNKASLKIGCDCSYISRLVTGTRVPSLEMVEQIAEGLELDNESYVWLNLLSEVIPERLRQHLLDLVRRGV